MNVGSGLAPLAGAPRPPRRRRAASRPPLSARIARGALELTMVLLLVGGLAISGASAWAYFEGNADGRAAAEKVASEERAQQEKDHRAEVDKLRADAKARLDAALLDAAARYDTIDTARREAQRDLALEQANTRRLRGERDAALARAADAGRVRSEALARAATGGTTEAEDTVGACRARADELRRALDEVLGGAGRLLRSREACGLDHEDDSGTARALLRHARAIEASERAVAPTEAAAAKP